MNQDIHKNENLLDLRAPHKKIKAKNNKKLYLRLVKVFALGLVLLVVATLLLIKTLHKQNLSNVEVIKNKISKHIVLPKDEQPALLTITDKNKLATPFLKQAENGDKMLVYQTAKKVILYRPSIDRIIDSGPVSIASPASP